MKMIGLVLVSLFASLELASAQEFKNIEYLCADWGPAMKLPAKKGEQSQFSNAEEEIYFLKQVNSFTRRKYLIPDPFSGNRTEDIGHGISIYLCKMKPDGSDKTEIKELWKNPNYPIDTQAQSTWMDVNRKTRKIALSVTFAGSDVTGLWTMNLDGSDLEHVIPPTRVNGHLEAIDSPSWTPDGQWIVFGESLRGAALGRIAKCDIHGSNFVYLTDGPMDYQPRVSPASNRILYVHDPKISLGSNGAGDLSVAATLFLMDLDGANKREIPNPEAKPFWPAKGVSGSYPAWSPDRKKIFFIGVADTIVDVSTGKTLWTGGAHPYTSGWPHWGQPGLVGFFVGGIVRTDTQTWESQLSGPTHLTECKTSSPAQCRW